MKTLHDRLKLLAWIFTALWLTEGAVVAFVIIHRDLRYFTAYAALHCVIWVIAYLAIKPVVCRQFRKIEKTMHDFGVGHAKEESLKSIMPISVGFSEMIMQYDSLLDKQEILRLSVEQSRLLALQNQMNPHFLYNTLDAIRGDALIAGMTELAATTEALSTFFRYTISELDRYATVGQEIGNVKDYFKIQQYRFGKMLRLEIDCGEASKDVDDLCIMRMTLQPIVENAIYHGLECKAKMGTVTIKMVQSQSELLIQVIDDGVGMSQQEVDRINSAMNSPVSISSNKDGRGGIALVNINTRIRLLFGGEYGVTVFSQKGIGSTVQVKFPITTRDVVHEKRITKN